MYSPADIETAYLKGESRLYERLARLPTALSTSIISIAALFALLYSNHVFNLIQSTHLGSARQIFYVVPHLAKGLGWLAVGSLPLLLLSPGLRVRVLPFATVGFALVLGYFTFRDRLGGSDLFWAAAYVPAILIFTSIYQQVSQRRGAKLVLTSVFSACYFLWVFLSLKHFMDLGLNEVLSYLFGFKGILFWFWAVSRAHAGKLAIEQVLNPMNAMRAWPWSTADGQKQDELLAANRVHMLETWWNGLLNILLGLFLLHAVFTMISGSLILYGKLLTNYTFHVLADVGTLNLLIGGARLFCYRIPDGTTFSFFAKTPGELWRRGSVHNFLFNREFVFWPVLRIVRNYWIALFAAFSLYYFNSIGFSLFESLLLADGTSEGFSMQKDLEVGRLLAFACHFGLLCVPAWVWRTEIKGLSESARSWLSVVVIHVLNLAVLYIVYGLIFPMLQIW